MTALNDLGWVNNLSLNTTWSRATLGDLSIYTRQEDDGRNTFASFGNYYIVYRPGDPDVNKWREWRDVEPLMAQCIINAHEKGDFDGRQIIGQVEEDGSQQDRRSSVPQLRPA
jgi:hypothetical protein